jgi:hypothetical protein
VTTRSGEEVLTEQEGWQVRVSQQVTVVGPGGLLAVDVHCLALQESALDNQAATILNAMAQPLAEADRLEGGYTRRDLLLSEMLSSSFGVVTSTGHPGAGDLTVAGFGEYAIEYTDTFQIARVYEGRFSGEEALRDCAARLVSRSARPLGIDEKTSFVAQRRLLDALMDFRLPRFGSPPSGWDQFRTVLSRGTGLVATGVLASSGHPVLCLFSAAGTFILWMARPTAAVLRRSLAEHVAEAVGTTVEDDDFR